MAERESLYQFLRRAWWELRFCGHAAMQRDFNDPRVQALVAEKLGRVCIPGVCAYDNFVCPNGCRDDV